MRSESLRYASALAAVISAWTASASAATHLRSPLPFGCVATLVDVRTGNGKSGYVSHYVTDTSYAYGEWRASGFGGQSLWKRSGTAWCKVRTGLKVLDRRALLAFGIPAPVAGRLLAAMRKRPEVAPPVAGTARAAHRASHR